MIQMFGALSPKWKAQMNLLIPDCQHLYLCASDRSLDALPSFEKLEVLAACHPHSHLAASCWTWVAAAIPLTAALSVLFDSLTFSFIISV